jgi:hypothetical protein
MAFPLPTPLCQYPQAKVSKRAIGRDMQGARGWRVGVTPVLPKRWRGEMTSGEAVVVIVLAAVALVAASWGMSSRGA